MNTYLLITSIVIFLCILLNRVSNRIGIPALLAFIVLGMLFGSDGIMKIDFDNYAFAEQICSTALIFIMFYGGFGTNWQRAKAVAVKSVLLSTIGVIITCFLTGLFCHFALNMSWEISFLLGALISSTDAASVFSILRSKKLNLKYNTASLLEVESGSNDPCAYMLTVAFISISQGSASPGKYCHTHSKAACLRHNLRRPDCKAFHHAPSIYTLQKRGGLMRFSWWELL